MDKLTKEEVEALTSAQRRAYEAGKVSAEHVWKKGWLGKPEYRKAKKAKASKGESPKASSSKGPSSDEG